MTEFEKEFLNNIDKTFKWIARDKDGELNVYRNKPYKMREYGCWETDSRFCSLKCFSHLFHFIIWEDLEPKKLEDLRNVELS